MSISTLGLIVWFGVYGLSHFMAFSHSGLVLAITALVIAIALILGK